MFVHPVAIVTVSFCGRLHNLFHNHLCVSLSIQQSRVMHSHNQTLLDSTRFYRIHEFKCQHIIVQHDIVPIKYFQYCCRTDMHYHIPALQRIATLFMLGSVQKDKFRQIQSDHFHLTCSFLSGNKDNTPFLKLICQAGQILEYTQSFSQDSPVLDKVPILSPPSLRWLPC